MKYDGMKYKCLTWKHPYMFHWLLNPGIAFNELILGQRVAKEILVERSNTKTLAERSFIQCPHCNTLHSGLKWSHQNKTAFKNWFGLYCDNCDKIIPCLRNFTSLIILVVTAPVWFWFKDKWKENWLEQQRKKFGKPLTLENSQIAWWKMGLGFGITFFLLMCFWNYVILQEVMTLKKVLLSAFFDIVVAGLMFGACMKGFVKKSPGKRKYDSSF